MTDLLNGIRDEISARLQELRPLVDEQRRLQAALQALGGTGTRDAPSAPLASRAAPTSSRSRTVARAKPRKRAPRGANREAVLRAVKDRPGATGAELTSVSGVERNTLYGLLARLVQAGELKTTELPTGRTGYRLGELRPSTSSSDEATGNAAPTAEQAVVSTGAVEGRNAP